VLVEERKLAVEVGSGWSEGFDPNLYSVYATLAEGASTADLEQALNAEIARLVDTGVTAAELARAKRQVAASFWRGVSTIDGKARLLGEYAVLHGDYRKLFTAPDAYERVTAADVLAVARVVFNPQHRTVGVLVPRATAGH
jgi:zinc protease